MSLENSLSFGLKFFSKLPFSRKYDLNLLPKPKHLNDITDVIGGIFLKKTENGKFKSTNARLIKEPLLLICKIPFNNATDGMSFFLRIP